MANINQQLLNAIKDKTGLSRAQTYARIQAVASNEYLPRHLAAIKVAADAGVTINKYASGDELAELRRAGSPVTPPVQTALSASLAQNKTPPKTRKPTDSRKTPNQVFVVHGRDGVAKDAMFAFLRSVGVKPIEWNSAIAMTKKASPYVGEVLDAAFSKARAVVVLLTPDDWAQLREELVLPSDPPFEKR